MHFFCIFLKRTGPSGSVLFLINPKCSNFGSHLSFSIYTAKCWQGFHSWSRWREKANPIEFLHLIPDVALPEGDVDHRRLDVGVPHCFHDGEGIGAGHSHLRPEGVAKSMNANVGDTRAGAGPVEALPDIV